MSQHWFIEDYDLIAMKPTYHCIISSSDKNLISSDIILNVHPETGVDRIIQYVYEKVRTRTTKDVNDFGVFYNGEEIDQAKSIVKVGQYKSHSNNNFIKLEFEITDNRSEYSEDLDYDLDYDFDSEFLHGNFNVEVNLLSSNCDYGENPVITLHKSMVPLQASGSRILKMILEDIRDLESSKDTLCQLHDNHSIEQFLGFKIKGNDDESIIYLRDGNGIINDSFLDMPLSKILGIDFMPEKTTRLTLMFFVQHEPKPPLANEKTLTFISEFPLLYNKMVINDKTTVLDVGIFLIHTSLIHPKYALRADGDLITYYNDEVMDLKDGKGNEILLKTYIHDDPNPIVHLELDSTILYFLKDVDTFWQQKFYPVPFTSRPIKSDNDNEEGGDDKIKILNPEGDEVVDFVDNWDEDQEDFIPSDTSNISYNDHLFYHDHDEDNIADTVHYVTEDGRKVKVLDGIYRKCIIDNHEQKFINTRYLEPIQAKLRFKRGETDTLEEIPLESVKQFNIRSNKLAFDKNVINQLEARLHMTIVPEDEVEEVLPEVTETIENNLLRENRWYNRLFVNIKHIGYKLGIFMFLILKTLYYVVINNFMIFMLLSELAFFVSYRTTGIILALVTTRTIFANNEVRSSWIEFLQLDRYSVKRLKAIMLFVAEDKLTFEFYESLTYPDYDPNNTVVDDETNPNYKNVLIKLIKNVDHETIFPSLREHINTSNVDLDALVKYANSPTLSEIESAIMMKAMNELIILFILVLIKIDTYPDIAYKKEFCQDMNELLGAIEKEMYKKQGIPVTKRVIDGVKQNIRRIRNINWGRQILEYIVPNPLRDNIIMSVMKNIILFVMLLVPMVNLEVDKILKERKEAIERHEAKLREEEELQNPHIQDEIVVATGVEIHHPDEA